MPTGVALRNARELLFDAAERVLVQDGPSGLTSRAVTTEARVAKGVLHRHFPDFEAFLFELVLDRDRRVGEQTSSLCETAGTGTVAGNLAGALTTLFGPVAVAVVGLVISRDGLRARLRQAGSAGIPILYGATAMIAAYLAAEQELGRIAADADVEALAPMLIGTGHLLFADRTGPPVDPAVVQSIVASALAGVTTPPER